MRYNGNFKISEQIYFLRSYENTGVLTNFKTDLKTHKKVVYGNVSNNVTIKSLDKIFLLKTRF